MNEPSVWGGDVPELVEFDYDGRRTAHPEAHNIYGMQMARSTFEGAQKRMAGRRPFVLTRAAFAGTQRYAAIWTGDNTAADEHMLGSVRQICSLGLSGMAFCGCDIGGFAGDASADLFARWMSLGVFMPLFRTHSALNTRAAEPWAFGEEVEEIARNAIRLRYRLLPYIYATFYESSRSGLPVVRTLAVDFPHDAMIYEKAFQHQFFFGENLLVAPLPAASDRCEVYLPAGEWYDFFTDGRYDGPRRVVVAAPRGYLPMFVRAGAVIPMQLPAAHTSQPPLGPLELHLYRGTRIVHFNFYEDDGLTDAHRQGAYLLRQITLKPRSLHLDAVQGAFPSRFSRLKLFFHGFPLREGGNVRINEEPVYVKTESLCYLAPITRGSPAERPQYPWGRIEVPSVTVDHLREEMRVHMG
jgi:alpha-glucosidase